MGAQPSPTNGVGPGETTADSPVTIDKDGWIHYENLRADKLDLINPKRSLLTLERSADGSCVRSGESSGGSRDGGSQDLGDHFSEETAYNPGLCQVETIDGYLTVEATRQLSEQDGAASGAQTKSDGATTRADLPSHTAHQKGRWIDPVNITITSLTANISWKYSGTSATATDAYWVPYTFSWDGWSRSGTPSNATSSYSDHVTLNGHEQFRNTDFELAMEVIFGPAAVYAACGFDFSTAIFDHTETIRGYENGGWTSNYNDTANGGCSNLVRYSHQEGYGNIN